ncbi:Lon protease family protein [Desulfovibrio cuneatus]|uniref:Lon protease family protein n=1 Tax=Desulfovibrio cuneatus TaxID=159728 RepID=UPI0004037EE8|nr:ATP-binding protein [Desulfovibrio cuneatus]
MAVPSPLAPGKLKAFLDPARVPYANSNDIPKNGKRHSPQHRVLEALKLGLHIKAQGYNIYLAGEADLGRSYLLWEYLMPRAKRETTPPDLVYVHNFDDDDAPVLMALPSGMGHKLKKSLHKTHANILKETALRLERTTFTKRRSSLFDKFQNQREQLFKQMNKLAGTQGFILDLDEAGSMTLYPQVDGKRLNEQEFEKLDESRRSVLKQKGDSLMQPMMGFLRKLAKAEQHFLEEERSLDREIIEEVLTVTLDPLMEKVLAQHPTPELKAFLIALRADVLDNIEAFMPAESPHGPGPGGNAPVPHHESQPAQDMSARFGVNVFVDNTATEGAPIVFEDHPTMANLMGCIEREAEMGALVTDFTLIKAGSLHKANGGYLVVHVDDVLQATGVWEALLRSLRSGLSRVEDTAEEESTRTKGLHPAPVPLNLKVILIGKEEVYELLLDMDDRFSRLFKIKAHLSDSMPRNSTNIRSYLSQLKRIITDEDLVPFDRDALAGIVDHGSRLVEDQSKLSLKFPQLREIMIEASAYATMEGKPVVTGEVLTQALRARNFRSNLVEEAFMEEYDRKIIKVATSGNAVGVVNGLAVSFYGDFEFGLPHQISCTIGAGSGGIVDLERDAQLGGPIHTKAMMILKSYLVGAFAHNKPLMLTGSLGFEQNYVGIEGDSASGAELAALLSAISGVPVNLSLAFTGAVSQSGQIMAVGGVTRKIEGYFEVCKRHGLTGGQGVIMPRDNITHLMLHEDVINAVKAGKFRIYPVEHITQALELLTGVPAGRLNKDGKYTKGSLYAKVDERLKELARLGMPGKPGRR